jgi:hypothetical protein
MLKKLLPVVLLSSLLAGCQATFTNLTPQVQPRSTNHLYTVEVALNTRQQTVLWETIVPQLIVGQDLYPMRPTPLMTNRWEGLIPVDPGSNVVFYRYKFDFSYNKFGKQPGVDSATSPQYMLRIVE